MLQLPNRSSESRNNNISRKFNRRGLKIGLVAIALVVVAAMVLGIVSTFAGKTSSSTYPAATSEQAPYVSDSAGSYNGAAAPVPTMAAATKAASAAGGANYAAPAPAAIPGSGSGYTYDNTSAQPLPNNPDNRMIIRNASLSVQADDVEKLLGDIRALAAEQNGVVTQANTSIRDNKTYANITIQVPSAAFDNTISRLRKLAYKVDSENSTSQDVTEEFVDVDAQVRNLKATEASYLDLMKKATSVNDTITIQRELNNVRSQIERLQGRMNYLQKKSDFSTISLSISPKGVADTTKTQEAWDAGKVLERAWEGSLRGLQGLATVLITLLVYAWWVLPLLALAYFGAKVAWKRVNRSTPPPAAPTQPSVTP
jgi:hypothetical protein